MICYMDKWWCKAYKECDKPCDRALTDEVYADAMVWWKGENPPIDCRTKPTCFKEISNGK